MEQHDNIAGGHIAGGDVKVTSYGAVPETFMFRMRKKFEHDSANNVEFKAVVEALQYYQEAIDPKPIGLERKLELGDRRSDIPEALRAKELFVKCMARYTLSEAAQLVIAYCLGRINDLFKAHVVPLVNHGAGSEEVDTALVEHVVQPVLQQLEANFLDLMPQHLTGMVYYLTANCFLNWRPLDRNAHLPPSA